MKAKVAIPSYKRADVVAQRSIPTLLALGVKPEDITVFVASETERKDYAKTVPKNIEIVVGVPGLIHQRRFYNGHFPKGTPLLNVDDDLYDLKLLTRDGKKLVSAKEHNVSLPEVVDYAFAVCSEHGARLWGISAVDNAFYMNPHTSVGLRYICGIFHGSYAGDPALCGSSRALESSGEDFETTLRSYVSNGAVVRLDWLCPKTKYFAAGGMREELGGTDEARQRDHEKNLLRIAKASNGLASTYRKADGVLNIKLKTMPSVKDDSKLPVKLP